MLDLAPELADSFTIRWASVGLVKKSPAFILVGVGLPSIPFKGLLIDLESDGISC